MTSLDWLNAALRQREADGLFRRLQHPPAGLVDVSSNDYLGLAREAVQLKGQAGSGGSRLLRGNSPEAEALEAELAAYHKAEAALLFPSGYAANLALLSSLPTRHDRVYYDETVHASIRDGLRLGMARAHSFRHNGLPHLRELLNRHAAAGGRRFVVTESVFSMDGDGPDLAQLTALSEETGAHLLLDEAHATGLLGPGGGGQAMATDTEDRFLARVITFGKALGAHGAAVLGPKVLRTYLINVARPFIYTTAPPPVLLAHLRGQYRRLPGLDAERAHVLALAEQLRESLLSLGRGRVWGGSAAILAYQPPPGAEVSKLAAGLQGAGFDVRAIRPPTVPPGTARLRFCLHAFNTAGEVSDLAEAIAAGISNQ